MAVRVTALVGIGVLIAVVAAQAAWSLWWLDKRPFDVGYGGHTMTIDPTTGDTRLHDTPTPDEVAAIYAWLRSDWAKILNSRFRWRILRQL